MCLVTIFPLVLFDIKNNFLLTKKFKLGDKLDSTGSVGFKNQKEVIVWIYDDVNEQDFNVDVYVPPVIPYSYDYLFKWIGSTKYGYTPTKENVPNLYLLYESDGTNPQRLSAWLSRQEAIAKLEESRRFGGITVDRRVRY